MKFFALGNIGIKALFYYITTTSCGISLSVLLSQTIRPGEWKLNVTDNDDGSSNVTDVQHNNVTYVNFVTVDTILDLLRYIIAYFYNCCLIFILIIVNSCKFVISF